MASRAFFGEDQDAIHRDVEHPARRLNELHVGAGKLLPNLRCQTGSAGFVVSNDAVLNRDAHRGLAVEMGN